VSGCGDETVCMLQIQCVLLIPPSIPTLSLLSLRRGIAFLWHMVRCIMAVLLLVGDRKETPDIVSR
jgi:hypothetical protein